MPWGGHGVFAVRGFRRGEVVLHFGGPIVPVAQVADFTHYLEIGDGRFLGPSGSIDDLVNHSCRPNTAVERHGSGALLRAVRGIREGEEITFDYSTVMVEDPTTFSCHCGHRNCRGTITAWQGLPRRKQTSYIRRGMVPAFVARRFSR